VQTFAAVRMLSCWKGHVSAALPCGAVSPAADHAQLTFSAERWRAYIADFDEVAIYCPACAAREFGAAPPGKS
jgi:hypothetical protein